MTTREITTVAVDSYLKLLRRPADLIVGLLPSSAVVDSFQHWLYTHPGHSRGERDATWISLTGPGSTLPSRRNAGKSALRWKTFARAASTC